MGKQQKDKGLGQEVEDLHERCGWKFSDKESLNNIGHIEEPTDLALSDLGRNIEFEDKMEEADEWVEKEMQRG